MNADPWSDALTAAHLVARDPHRLGGICIRARPGPVRDAWLDYVRRCAGGPDRLRRIPAHVAEGRLLGGLDLTATLAMGKPITERGLLAECDGQIAVLAMAERASESTISHLSSALDNGMIRLAREGVQGTHPARLGVIALDESEPDDAPVSARLTDRLALFLDLDRFSITDLHEDSPLLLDPGHQSMTAKLSEAQLETLCALAAVWGIQSLRPCLMAARVAELAAMLQGRAIIEEADLALACRLVLAPRATRMPAPPDTQPETQTPPPDAQTPPEPGDASGRDQSSQDRLIEAAQAALPADILAMLSVGANQRQRASSGGKSGQGQRSKLRGRPIGTMPGSVGGGARISAIATLRAAAPWQRIRRAENEKPSKRRISVQKQDIRVRRFLERSETTTIFVVDASGSSALHRLAEAKGAVELLLADCYVRRDQVALIAFRGQEAELLLPPTRSLTRAKRDLSALPAGGGTPLASALRMSCQLANKIQQKGGTPSIVMLTDARANVCLDGEHGRGKAFEESLQMADQMYALGLRSAIVDISPRPHRNAQLLASRLGGRYLPLPHADARKIRQAVETV